MLGVEQAERKKRGCLLVQFERVKSREIGNESRLRDGLKHNGKEMDGLWEVYNSMDPFDTMVDSLFGSIAFESTGIITAHYSSYIYTAMNSKPALGRDVFVKPN